MVPQYNVPRVNVQRLSTSVVQEMVTLLELSLELCGK